MKTQPMSTALCRTPAFAMDAELFEVWEDLKAHIKNASPDFYILIEDKTPEDWPNLGEKLRFTIWKYFNRSCFRATPFGSFAAFTVVPLSEAPAVPLSLQSEMLLHRFTDWDVKALVDKSQLHPELRLCSNSSTYTLAGELRYITYDGQAFQLSASDLFPELEFIIDQCRGPLRLQELLTQLQIKFDLSPESGQDLIAQLLEIQVLFSELDANITGTDYFSRLGIENNYESPAYLLSERPLEKGNLSTAGLKHLPAFFEFAAKLVGKADREGLNEFKSAFMRKFEGNEVSLMQALDPELGIGYQNLEQTSSEALIDLPNALSNNKKTTLDYGDFERFLLRAILSGNPIELSDFKLVTNSSELKLPNSFNVLLQFHRGQPVLISAGGCTANALNGRFSLASQEVETLNREIASLELTANPGVVFVEVAYQAEKHIDNINRRKHHYTHELPILSWSEGTEIIRPDDLYVSIRNQEIILRSTKLNQRVVPRLSSAYNYGRSDLSLYRFLCDLQYQGLHSQLSFQPWDYFPGLDFYPRTEFQGIIVSPARWRVPESLIQMPQEEFLQAWLAEQHIKDWFKCGIADHVLYFDPQSATDRWAFLQYLQQHNGKEIYIWEALLDFTQGSRDENGRPYNAEWVLNFAHEEQVYSPLSEASIPEYFPIPEKQLSLPAEDWVYVEIYCHPSRANGLLLGPLQEFVQIHEQVIDQWFFIRYIDPAPHLRFRFKALDDATRITLIQQLNQLLKPGLQEGTIRDLQLKTYYREFRRYGAKRIDLAEAFFHRDSLFVLEQLQARQAHEPFYVATLWYLEKLLDITFPGDIDQQLAFTDRGAQAFVQEFNWGIEQFKQINQSYKQIRQLQSTKLLIDLTQLTIFEELLGLCESETIKNNLLADLIHMHVNRLFSEQQRKQEALLYQFLLLYLKAKKATLNTPRQYSA